MKASFSSLLLMLLPLAILSAQFESNLIQLGNNGSEDIIAVFPDDQGDIWAAGTFSGTLEAGQTFNSLGEADIWWGKWTKEGNLAAIYTMGSSRGDELLECKLLANGNLFLSGYFFKTLVLPDTIIEVANSIKAVFLLEMSLDGKLVKHQLITGTGQKEIGRVSIEEDQFFIAGSFSNDLIIADQSIAASGLEDAFILTLDRAWNPQFLKAFPSGGRAAGRSLLQLSPDTFLLAGHYSGDVQLDTFSLITTTPDFDLFIAFLNSDFEVMGARRMGGVYDSQLYTCERYLDSLLIFTGNHRGVINLDGNTRIQTMGLNDNMFAFALNLSGEVVWGRSIGGSSDENLQSHALTSNTLYLAGFGQGGFEIDEQELPIGSGFSHGFLLAYNPLDGTNSWFSNLQGDEFVISKAIGTGQDGSCYWGLSFSSELYANSTTQNSRGFYDVVFGKLRDDLSSIEAAATENMDINIFPNPFSGTVQIDGLTPRSRLFVFNQQGQAIPSCQKG
jgi:hypothetical protein